MSDGYYMHMTLVRLTEPYTRVNRDGVEAWLLAGWQDPCEENVTWVRGHVRSDDPCVQAALVAQALRRNA